MTLSTQPYKGTRDFFPAEMRERRWMFGRMREVVEHFGFEEYDGPMLESFDLYAAKTGEEIVNNQLYWLMDRGERKLAVRPEMTPTLARMVASKIHELPRPVRWYSIPNLWRYERPQRGRLREHWQLNVDVLGGDPLEADIEILSVALELVEKFGGLPFVRVKVNHRGLIDQFFKERLKLSADAALGVTKALDARAKVGEEAYAEWLTKLGVSSEQRTEMEAFFASPFSEISARYPGPAATHLQALFDALSELGFKDQVEFDPMILRGMDYYTGTVFEMYDTSPDNRRALFGGGRYDNLVGMFGKEQLPGVGFGWGDVGFQNFLETHGLLPKPQSGVDVVIGLPSAEFRPKLAKLARDLRAAGVRVATPLVFGGFGAHLKAAVKLGARFAVLVGDAEWAKGEVLVKDLQAQAQTSVPVARVVTEIQTKLQ